MKVNGAPELKEGRGCRFSAATPFGGGGQADYFGGKFFRSFSTILCSAPFPSLYMQFDGSHGLLHKIAPRIEMRYQAVLVNELTESCISIVHPDTARGAPLSVT
jgi:hypothetical protein